jgi:hypothetical protein
VSAELRKLIGEMSRANPLWGAPHIHGELLKLGFEVACRRSPAICAAVLGHHRRDRTSELGCATVRLAELDSQNGWHSVK